MSQLKPKILIVDDRPENLFVLQKLLAKLDVETLAAASGAEALGLALEHDFSVAIVDVQMPEMDGYELVSLLRGNRTTMTLPVIFVSAIYSDEYHHRKGYDAGAVDFLSKPFVPEILLSKVNIFLELYNQRREVETLNAQLKRFNEELEQLVHERTQELEQAYETLAQLDQSKSDFITVVAHELRTPLSLIKGYAEMLREPYKENGREVFEMQVDGIATGARRMHEVVNTMVDVIRIDNGTVDMIPEACAFMDIMLSLRDELADALRERNLTLHLVDLQMLPDLQADPDLLTKLFYHLVINAIKYTPDGGAITVSGRCFGEGGQEQVEIVVQDTGIGIDPAHQELIFTKFYQTGPVALHSSGKTKFKGGGSGLGLAIAQGFAAAHGGKIWVVSAGHDEVRCPGSAFHVLLPVRNGALLEQGGPDGGEAVPV
jgi:signal transduction histidine kinase